MTGKAVGYLRVSGKGQIKGHGLDRQREIVSKFASKNGIDVVEYYEEAHTGTELERPALTDMLARLVGNGIKTVIVEQLDRLARELNVQLSILAKLELEGITLISASTGEDVTSSMRDDPMKKALVQIQGVFAELDKSLTVRKLRKARETVRSERGKCEGAKAFGEKAGETAVLDRIRQLIRKPRNNKRLSYGKVAATLNAEGHQTRLGRPWNRGTVWNICKREGWV
tara:strand:- start:4150 stop:4830 length:681 start_codon:yes stop_codon:yes gene_type:complete